MLLVVCGMTFYEFYDPLNDSPWTLNFLNSFITICSCISAGLYLYYLNIYGDYLKWTNKMSSEVSIYAYNGYGKTITFTILLFIHQFYSPGQNMMNSKESTWDGEKRVYYGRRVNEYFTIIQITVHFFTALFIYINNSYWSNPRVQRLA